MDQDDTARKLSKQMNDLYRYLDASGVADYVRLANRPGRLLFLNFLSGIARGLGFTLGTAIVLALAYKIVSEIISMNIPYLTDVLTNLVNFVKSVE